MLDTFVISLKDTYIDRLTQSQYCTVSCRDIRASMQRTRWPSARVLCAIAHWEEEGTAGYKSSLRNKQKRLFKPSLSSCYLFDTHIASVFDFENKSAFWFYQDCATIIEIGIGLLGQNYYILFNFKPIEGGRFKNKKQCRLWISGPSEPKIQESQARLLWV